MNTRNAHRPHHITTRMANDIIAGDVVPNRGTVMAAEHHNDGEGNPLVVFWFRKDMTDNVVVHKSEITEWVVAAHDMVWVCQETTEASVTLEARLSKIWVNGE